VKLLRYGPRGHEKPALLAPDSTLRDLSALIDDLGGEALTAAGLERLRRVNPLELTPVAGSPRIGAPVAPVGKMVCVGLNYADHAAEAGMPVPDWPVIFMKATTAIVGPYDDIVLPRGSQKTDWEVELGVVIGDTARDVSRAQAPEHIAGYLTVHDVSERAFQLEHGGQWVKGKSCDTFGPIGPWLVTRDEVRDPQSLSLWLEVNQYRYQRGNTRTMIFDVAYLVSHISRYMTLMPGDIISTGTPPGVGMGQKPQRFLRAGDVVELGVEGLGTQRQHVVSS
jgi:2,4-didehydro-3-deoxy-L-rhamnonate hydrolase